MSASGIEYTSGGALLLDGKRTALSIRERIAAELKRLNNPQITLATVLVGENPASQIYIGMKRREAAAAGMYSHHVELPATITQRSLEQEIIALATDPHIHGILVQLPLPPGLDTAAIIECIPPEKDVDGLTERNMGKLVQQRPGLVPCTPLGVMRLLEYYKIPTQGKRAVVIGRSMLVGVPQVLLLGAKGIDTTVTLAHSRTEELMTVTREADILIAAAGMPKMITAQHVKPGASVFDVGVSRVNGKIQGDVDFDSVQAVASAITPMPGGTGPMTVSCLLENTMTAARLQGQITA